MKLNPRRLALVLVAVPALIIGMSGCSMIGKQNQTADASADSAAIASHEGQGDPDSQQFSFASSRRDSSRQSASRGNSGMFGFLGGGC
jgi:hypothetical protein